MTTRAVSAMVALIVTATAAQAQVAQVASPPANMSSEQAREEYAYAVGVQTAIWGRPFVDNVHTLYAH